MRRGDALPPEEIESDSMTFSMDGRPDLPEDAATAAAAAPVALVGDHIGLATCSRDEALACSYAFAQSVKLAAFETIVDASIEKVGILRLFRLRDDDILMISEGLEAPKCWCGGRFGPRRGVESMGFGRRSPFPKPWRNTAPSTWTRSW